MAPSTKSVKTKKGIYLSILLARHLGPVLCRTIRPPTAGASPILIVHISKNQFTVMSYIDLVGHYSKVGWWSWCKEKIDGIQ